MNSKREIRRLMPIVKKINSYKNEYVNLTADQMVAKAAELKERRKKEDGMKLLPEAFALVKEASRHVLNK